MCLWRKELLQCSHLLTELGSKSSDISNRRLVGKRLGDIGPLFVKTDRTFLFTFVHNIPAGVTGNIKTLTYLTDGHHTSVVQDVHVHVQCMYMCRRVSLLPFALQGLSIDNEFHLANIDSSPVHVPDGQHNTARRVKILLSQLLTRTHSIQSTNTGQHEVLSGLLSCYQGLFFPPLLELSRSKLTLHDDRARLVPTITIVTLPPKTQNELH